MKNKILKMLESDKFVKIFCSKWFGTLFFILIMAVGYAISWAIITGIIYLICFCFGIKFNLLIATGIWLVLCIVKAIFKTQRSDKT